MGQKESISPRNQTCKSCNHGNRRGWRKLRLKLKYRVKGTLYSSRTHYLTHWSVTANKLAVEMERARDYDSCTRTVTIDVVSQRSQRSQIEMSECQLHRHEWPQTWINKISKNVKNCSLRSPATYFPFRKWIEFFSLAPFSWRRPVRLKKVLNWLSIW